MMNYRVLTCIALLTFASEHALAQCPGNDMFRFPDADPPTGSLTPPPGLADGPMAPGTIKPDIGKRPYSLFGRLDTLVDGINRYCTAQLVEGTNILMTAAHCVRDNKSGKWLSDFRFLRASAVEAGEPLRKPLCIATRKDWVGPPPEGFAGNFFWPADYAFVILREPLDQHVLKLGIDAPEGPVTALGYPAAIDSRKSLVKADGDFLRVPGFDMGAVTRSDPALGLGMSGGAWVADLAEGEGNTGNVVIGHSTAAPPDFVIGPRFTVCAKELLEFVKTACVQQ
jgi:hypothetical protein